MPSPISGCRRISACSQLGQRTRLRQDGVRDAEVADVVDERAEDGALELVALDADGARELARQPGHARAGRIGRIEIDVAGAGQSGDVRGVHLGQRTPHPQGVADRGQEQRFGERRLDEVVGARIDARRDGVECPRVRARRSVGEGDDRHAPVGRVGADPATRLDAVAFHRPDAHEDGVRLTHGHGRQGGRAEGHRADGVAGGLERRGEGRVAARDILDDEDQSAAVIVGGHARAGCARTRREGNPYQGPGSRPIDRASRPLAAAQNIVEHHGAVSDAKIRSAAAIAPGRHSRTRPAQRQVGEPERTEIDRREVHRVEDQVGLVRRGLDRGHGTGARRGATGHRQPPATGIRQAGTRRSPRT